jgi:hypothetical protein
VRLENDHEWRVVNDFIEVFMDYLKILFWQLPEETVENHKEHPSV